MSVVTDDEILRLLQSGHDAERGFRMLMDKYQERLYHLIRRMVLDHDDTHDVLQETFVKVFRNIGSFEAKASLYTWLYRIASNESITFINKRKRIQSQQAEAASGRIAASLSSGAGFSGEEIERKLFQAMETLPEKQKLVFQLRYYEEMPYEQMSEVLGTSAGALKASYHHAVRKIEHFVKENPE